MLKHKKTMRWLLSLAVTGLLLGSLVLGACAKEESEQQKVFFSAQQTSHPFWLVATDGMWTANQKYNFDIQIGGPPYPDIVSQIQQLDAAIASGEYDAYIVVACSPPYFPDSINRAVDDGKTVVVICDSVPGGRHSTTIRTSDFEAGQMAGKLLVDAMSGDQATVSMQTADLTQLSLNERLDGFTDYVKDYPNITVLPVDTTGLAETTRVGIEVLSARLIASPEVDVLYIPHGNSGDIYNTVYADFKDRMDQMYIIAFDDGDTTLAGVDAGWIDGTIVQSQWNWGYGAVYQLHRMLDLGLPPTSEMVYTPTVVITKENIGTMAVDTRNPQVWLDFEAQEPK